MTMSLFQPCIVYKTIAATIIAAIIGYAFLDGGSHEANIATVIQTAYDMVSHVRDSPVVVGNQVGRMSITNEPRSGRKSPSKRRRRITRTK